jgi:hypothetical protein
MKRLAIFYAFPLILVLSVQAFSQSSNASLGGTVADVSGAVVPGVRVTATNTGTGVVSTTISNNSGIYSFPSLLPGNYKVAAEQQGFQVQTYTDVQLGNAAQVRLNFKLQVSGITEAVEVSVAADRMILESSSSSGDVLPDKTVHELPLVNDNALDLVRTMSGYIPPADPINNANAATIGGVSIANINVQRDGVSVSDVRYPAGVHSPTMINPDMVGEVRMIISPVDAEMGRGNGQVQVMTKSGTNAYRGSSAWDVQNSKLDSNQWSNNRTNTTPYWRNLNQYTVSLGGPIRKNKTFFFVLWNGQISRIRDTASPLALTPCARKGVFRYFDNWVNGRYGIATTTTGQTPTIAVVDFNGNPLRPATNPDGSAYAGQLRYASVFGKLLKTPSTGDCSDFNPDTDVAANTNWDPYRKAMDSTGFVKQFLSLMPVANSYDLAGGDGLNYAHSRWTRAQLGNDNMYGIGEDYQRKEINIKLDHNFSNRHRVNGSWSYESGWSDNNVRVWPKGYGGYADRRPQVLTVNFTSTVSATLLNEARFGMSRTGTNMYGVLENPQTGKEALKLVPQISSMPVAISLGTGSANFAVGNASNFWGGRWSGLITATIRDVSPRTTYGDTLTWIKEKHTFKAGAEVRFSKSYGHCIGACFPTYAYPLARGGDLSASQVQGINSSNMPGLVGTQTSGSQLAMQNLLSFFAGSLSSIQQTYWINSPNKLQWNNPLTENERIRDFRQKELSFFFKDDWKIHQNLTLNLGVRYDYYGVPYLKNGMTIALKGGAGAMYGISGRIWDEAFWKPGDARAALTELEFVGPGSPNPDKRIYPKDKNNFGPAVGFAWQLPWFGKGKTTLRGGYQLAYQAANRVNEVETAIGNPPGSVYTVTYTPTTYTDLSNMSSYIPAPQTVAPMAPFPLTDRTQTITLFDPNYASPYIQNLTMSLTRNIRNNLTVDVRYIGTLGKKNYTQININSPNFRSNGLLEAFNAARYGDDSNPAALLLDKLFQSVRGTKSGAAYLRASTQTATAYSLNFGARYYLANGDYTSLANMINYWPVNGVAGGLLRANGFSENFIKTNPQFQTVNVFSNLGTSNYQSMQAQITLLPTHGFSLQASYTLSKNLGYSGTWTDPLDRSADYTVLGSDRRHAFTTYGTFDLPLGPNGLVFKKSSGAVARLVQGWQMSWIGTLTSGNPMSVGAACMLYANCVPDQVGKFPFDKVGVYWENGAYRGNYFANALTLVTDPQVNNVTTKDSLRTYATSLYAVQDSAGSIVLQNPQPGTRGNFGMNRFYGPGTWNLDMALSKTIKFDEVRKAQIRVDVTNLFNHPQPSGAYNTSGSRIVYASNPLMSLTSNSNQFGEIPYKVGVRTFQARVRFSF